MRIVYYPDNRPDSGHYAATIGFFDGVHRGHRFVTEHLKEVAAAHGCQSMVITFERHPRQVVQPEWQPQLLTTLEEKTDLLAQAGIDVLVVLRFDCAMAGLSARQFMETVLRDSLRVSVLLTGYDNRFGHDRREGFNDYVAYGRELGIEVIQSRAVSLGDGRNVSSSLVRRLVSEGDVAQANECLGRHYRLTGRVVHGEQVGRQLGFPTANLELTDLHRLVPAVGVYAVEVAIEGDDSRHIGMMNIGHRPTFGSHHSTLEVNILDFIGDLYGKTLTVFFVCRLRSEQRFDSPEALKEQMQHDADQARSIVSSQLLTPHI